MGPPAPTMLPGGAAPAFSACAPRPSRPLVLRLKGYSILERRYAVSGGEIDLLAKRGRSIAFVEVKA